MKNSNALKALVTAVAVSVASLLPCRVSQNRIWEITELNVWRGVMDRRSHGTCAVDMQNLGQSLDSAMEENSRSRFDNYVANTFYLVCSTGRKTKVWNKKEIKEQVEQGAEKNYHSSRIGQSFKERLWEHIFCVS